VGVPLHLPEGQTLDALDARTTVSIVPTVATPKVPVTSRRAPGLRVAAGNMSRGINASHGPRRKITKRTQGVRDPPDSFG
jgi:predicted deacylase